MTLLYSSAAGDLSAALPLTDPAILPTWGAPVWRDEFDGDLSKWNIHTTGTEAQDTDGYFAPGMAFIQNGMLVMRTQRTAAKTITTTTGSGATAKTTTKVAAYATSSIDTQNKFSQRYGRWEVRLKALEPMHSRGIWPAFWLRNDTPGGGENDIYEAVGTPCANPKDYPNDGSVFSSTMYQNTGAKVTAQFSGSHLYKLGAPIWDFHTYACEWIPSGMTNYVDGKVTLKVTDPYLAKGFVSKANIRITKFVGTNYAGRPNTTDTRDTDDMLVDYVRVWAYPTS